MALEKNPDNEVANVETATGSQLGPEYQEGE